MIMESVHMFLFGLVVGYAAAYVWMDYKFSKAIEGVLDVIAEQREGALDE